MGGFLRCFYSCGEFLDVGVEGVEGGSRVGEGVDGCGLGEFFGGRGGHGCWGLDEDI